MSERSLATPAVGRHGDPLRLGTAALRPNPTESNQIKPLNSFGAPTHNRLGRGRDAAPRQLHRGVGRRVAAGNERKRENTSSQTQTHPHHQQHREARRGFKTNAGRRKNQGGDGASPASAGKPSAGGDEPSPPRFMNWPGHTERVVIKSLTVCLLSLWYA
jgi:hypothetical protein